MKYNTKLIDEYLKVNKLTKKALCKKCGITIESLRKIYKQDENVNPMVINKLVEKSHLGYPEFLMYETEEMVTTYNYLTGGTGILKNVEYNVSLIDNFLIKNNLTKQQFCNLCNISNESLNQIYENNMLINFKFVNRVIIELGVKLEDFILFKD